MEFPAAAGVTLTNNDGRRRGNFGVEHSLPNPFLSTLNATPPCVFSRNEETDVYIYTYTVFTIILITLYFNIFGQLIYNLMIANYY